MAASGRRLTCLFLLYSLLLITLSDGREGRAQDGSGKPDAAATNGQNQMLRHEDLDDEQSIPEFRLRGRRLALRGETTLAVRTNGGTMKRCGRGGGEGEETRVMCRQRFNGRFSVDRANFVAFNADYNAPRHHPPKNN